MKDLLYHLNTSSAQNVEHLLCAQNVAPQILKMMAATIYNIHVIIANMFGVIKMTATMRTMRTMTLAKPLNMEATGPLFAIL